jgi:putative tryptophan/tyrosine transport system substrate-binding protein
MMMERREFIAGIALTLYVAKARAQSSDSLPRLGWLFPSPPNNVPNPGQDGFREALVRLGWLDGRTIRINQFYAGDGPDLAATLDARANEIVALKPDVIFTGTSRAVDAVRRATKTIPIVFIGVNNPLAAGFVSSLAHPGGNITGFANFEPSTIGKMTNLLKEVAPRIRTIAFIYTKTNDIGSNWSRDWIISEAVTDQVQRASSVRFKDAPVENEEDIERTFEKLGEDPATAAIPLPDGYLLRQRSLIVNLAARYHVPTIYPFAPFATAGGLMSYGNDLAEQGRQAAGYVDRILRGTNPGDLPVQLPTKYEFVINMKAANALGITIPPTLLASADNVIE